MRVLNSAVSEISFLAQICKLNANVCRKSAINAALVPSVLTLSDGRSEGCSLGISPEGKILGLFDGRTLGLSEGDNEGPSLGKELGEVLAEGFVEPMMIGLPLGSDEGI